MFFAEVLLVIFLLLLVLFIIWYVYYHYEPKQLGTWKELWRTDCDSGLRTVAMFCEVNPVSNRGCEYNNEMITGVVLMQELCSLTPTSATLNINKGPCTGPPCVAPGTLGTRTVTVSCDNTGLSGPVNCSALLATTYTGPTGVSGNRHRIVNLNPGDSITYTESCSELTVCSTYTSCPQDSVFHIREACSVTNGIEEGTWLQSRSCPGICTDPSCSNIIPTGIADRTAPLPLPESICTPASCLRLCRTLSKTVGNNVYDSVLGNYFYLQVGTSYVVPVSTPWPYPQSYNPGARSNASTIDQIGPVPLALQPDGTTVNNCSVNDTKNDSVLLLSIGYRSSVSATMFSGVIATYIANYFGFLSGTNAIWMQGAVGYSDPGITSGQADIYQIEVLSQISSDTYSISISLAGNPVMISGTPLTNVQAVIRPNSGSRFSCATYARY